MVFNIDIAEKHNNAGADQPLYPCNTEIRTSCSDVVIEQWARFLALKHPYNKPSDSWIGSTGLFFVVLLVNGVNWRQKGPCCGYGE